MGHATTATEPHEPALDRPHSLCERSLRVEPLRGCRRCGRAARFVRREQVVVVVPPRRQGRRLGRARATSPSCPRRERGRCSDEAGGNRCGVRAPRWHGATLGLRGQPCEGGFGLRPNRRPPSLPLLWNGRRGLDASSPCLSSAAQLMLYGAGSSGWPPQSDANRNDAGHHLHKCNLSEAPSAHYDCEEQVRRDGHDRESQIAVQNFTSANDAGLTPARLVLHEWEGMSLFQCRDW